LISTKLFLALQEASQKNIEIDVQVLENSYDKFVNRLFLEMANHLEISESSLRHHLEKLKRENLIRRSGPDKGGRWLVIS
ncbi:MAG: transcriptional regulator, partial [Dysgonamonadaceae bacterium]|nr:transcriptional regulator [Dysgonamonadaceae bacterium]